jgi:hypothetical protein
MNELQTEFQSEFNPLLQYNGRARLQRWMQRATDVKTLNTLKGIQIAACM